LRREALAPHVCEAVYIPGRAEQWWS
jgi:hypothetical protein